MARRRRTILILGIGGLEFIRTAFRRRIVFIAGKSRFKYEKQILHRLTYPFHR